jgi:hypothetical protein
MYNYVYYTIHIIHIHNVRVARPIHSIASVLRLGNTRMFEEMSIFKHSDITKVDD